MKGYSRARNLVKACELFIESIGEDPKRDGLRGTPLRFARAFKELTVGYRQDGDTLVNNAFFDAPTGNMVVVHNIEFYSLCEHHVLPFFGRAHVAYIPSTKVIGLSKIPRIVNMFARRLQLQERLNDQVVEELERLLKPQGVACVMEARHLCMMMRGVESQSAVMSTSAMRGVFLTQPETRQEFLNLVLRRSENPA